MLLPPVLGQVDVVVHLPVVLRLRHRRRHLRSVPADRRDEITIKGPRNGQGGDRPDEAEREVGQHGEDEPPRGGAGEHDPPEVRHVEDVKVLHGERCARRDGAHLVALVAVRVRRVEVGHRRGRLQLAPRALVGGPKELVRRESLERVSCALARSPHSSAKRCNVGLCATTTTVTVMDSAGHGHGLLMSRSW